MTATDTLPPGVDIRVLGGKSPQWAEGYRRGWKGWVSGLRVDGFDVASLPLTVSRQSGKDDLNAALIRFALDTDNIFSLGITQDFMDGYKEGWEARERSNDDED